MATKHGIVPPEENRHNAVLTVTLRKLRLELSECRRGGAGVRAHHRMEMERLLANLVKELERYDWADEILRRLKKVRTRVRSNGLSSASCQDLEILMERLQRFERAECGVDPD